MSLPTADLNPGADARLQPASSPASHSLWGRAASRFAADRAAMIGLAIVMAFFVVALGVWLDWWGGNWAEIAGGQWQPPSAEHWFGTTILGQDIFARAIFSTRTAQALYSAVRVTGSKTGLVSQLALASRK